MNRYLEQFYEFGESFYLWIKGLSERTLGLASVVILYLTFLPDLVAYLNNLTDQLPSLNSFTIVTIALVIMNVRAIFSGDKVGALIHLAGFISQIAVISFILLK